MFCYFLSLFVLSTFVSLEVQSFAVLPSSTRQLYIGGKVFATSTAIGASESAAGKYFQLEELEDKEKCATELLLKADKTVEVGVTDGPRFVAASGTWEQGSDGSFKMVLERTFQSGTDNKKRPTTMGEFEYKVDRVFTGDMTVIGGKLAMTGLIHNMDEVVGDEEVGYFNMIDTAEEEE